MKRNAKMDDLISTLKNCKHENRSLLLPNDRSIICFECGSTIRPEETDWTAPWAWRNL